MKSKYKLTMCRLCLCENQCFYNIFGLNDWHGYIAADVISNLLQFQVCETDSYPHVVCYKCLVKLTDFKLFKECCQRSIAKYDNMFVSRENVEEIKPEMDIGDGGSGLELCERDPLRGASSDVTIKSEELIIDSDSYEVSESPLIETEDTGGCRSDTELCELNPVGEESSHVSTHLETVTNSKYLQCLVNMRSYCLPKGEVKADSCMWSTSTNDQSILENSNNVSLLDNTEASSCGTMEIIDGQEILPGEGRYTASFCQHDLSIKNDLDKERRRMEEDIGGDREAYRVTGPEKRVRENRRGLECFHCGIVLMNKLVLVKHMKVHGYINSYECAECDKIFRFNSQLKRHILTHTGYKPYKCAECSKSFTNDSHLKSHMRLHTGFKPYKCSKCSKCFAHNVSLKMHMISHTASKPYKCAECSKSFCQSSDLKTHLRIHTGSRPYKCTECNKSFSQSSSLKIHIRIHTGSKPYKCTECSKGFTANCNLTAHMRIHTGSKPYKCAECNKSFTQNSSLKKHMRSHTTH